MVIYGRKFLNYQRQKILVIGSSFFDKKIFNKVNFLIYDKNNKFHLINFIKKLFTFLKKDFSFIKFYHYFNYYYFFSLFFKKNVIDYTQKNKIKRIYINYEGQPFQNYFINSLKVRDKKIKIYGYVFNTQQLPLHLLYTNQKVDYLVVYDKQIFYQLMKIGLE